MNNPTHTEMVERHTKRGPGTGAIYHVPAEAMRDCIDYNPETGVLTWKR